MRRQRTARASWRTRLALVGMVTCLGFGITAQAQEPAAPKAKPIEHPSVTSLEAIDAYYRDRQVELERWRLKALTDIAAKSEGEAASTAYRQAFLLAVARNLYAESETAAEALLSSKERSAAVDPDVHAMAVLIDVIASAERGAYDESFQTLKELVARRPEPGTARPVPPETIIEIGDAYLRRLARGGRFDLARQLCELAISSAREPLVKAHFEKVLARVALVGKVAPAITARDLDGKAVSLADAKGKAVLIVFWATWCPPCFADLAQANALLAQHKDAGLVVIGVNLDALQTEGAGNARALQSKVRRALVEHGVAWPNIIGGAGDQDVAKAFGVTMLPANVLIGRDGAVANFDVPPRELTEAIRKTLGK